MIKANHTKQAGILFNFYESKLLSRHFENFILANAPPSLNESSGLIVTPNHFSWWDGFFIHYLTRKLTHRKMYIMMLEEQLRRYWFFRFVGAYSINLNSPKGMAESLYYTSGILENVNNFAVIYPQGKLEEFGNYPFKLKSGLRNILRQSNKKAFVLPLAFKIYYGEKKKPDVIVRFGELIEGVNIIKDFDCFSKEFNENIRLLDKFNFEFPLNLLA